MEIPMEIQTKFISVHCKKKYATVWNQKLHIGEHSGISSLKIENSGI
jgi:hypothetical protein